MPVSVRQSGIWSAAATSVRQLLDWLEGQLERERDQLPNWVPVGLGLGIAIWFLAGDRDLWIGCVLLCGAVVCGMATIARGSRIGQAIIWLAILSGVGLAAIWLRSSYIAAPVLVRPMVASLSARIDGIEYLPARDRVRLVLATAGDSGVPPRVRINVPGDKASPELQVGAVIYARARLMPPAGPALPGAYDFSRRAWFEGLGATGSLIGDIKVVSGPQRNALFSDWRQEMAAHVRSRIEGPGGAIAATLATGDRGAIAEEDAEAMRRSGLAHLLSISGLHVTAVVGATYLLILKLLALSPALALRWRLPLVAAGGAAIAAVGYTLLTGAQVPTIRACVAALLVLLGLMLGREAITLRMLAVGAIVVLLLWPESLLGPSFQLSFAAVTAIIALHEHPRVKDWFARREEGYGRKIARGIAALFLTGLVVELALMPIALFHFHKAGLYGALANIVAIPLTTFVIMPLEALALLLDSAGLGGPIWALCGFALNGLVGLAHMVSDAPGSVTMLPTMDYLIFGLFLAGGMWLCLWRERWRIWGLAPIVVAVVALVASSVPDIYITSDGRHVGIRSEEGEMALLRTRTGDFAREMLLENAGVDSEPGLIEDLPGAQCNADSCVIAIESDGRTWRLLATRSRNMIPAMELAAACARVDIVVSDRWLPRSCEPRWLKIDRNFLSESGGLAIDLSDGDIDSVRELGGAHRWTRWHRQSDAAPASSSAE